MHHLVLKEVYAPVTWKICSCGISYSSEVRLIILQCYHLIDKEADAAEMSRRSLLTKSVLSSRTLLTSPEKDFITLLCLPLWTILFWMASLSTNGQPGLPIAVFLHPEGRLNFFKFVIQNILTFLCLPIFGNIQIKKPP